MYNREKIPCKLNSVCQRVVTAVTMTTRKQMIGLAKNNIFEIVYKMFYLILKMR